MDLYDVPCAVVSPSRRCIAAGLAPGRAGRRWLRARRPREDEAARVRGHALDRRRRRRRRARRGARPRAGRSRRRAGDRARRRAGRGDRGVRRPRSRRRARRSSTAAARSAARMGGPPRRVGARLERHRRRYARSHPSRRGVSCGAVSVDAGPHRVVFSYRTPGLRVGAGVSVGAWLVLLGTLGSSSVVRRRRSPDPCAGSCSLRSFRPRPGPSSTSIGSAPSAATSSGGFRLARVPVRR